jgi:LytR cell envelope-related transcriptional attenuator
MSEHATDAAASDHARQRRRSLITLAVVLLGLFFAFWYAWSYYQAETAAVSARPPAATCAPFDPKAVRVEDTTVNVYNASNRSGLAASAAKTLAERGFIIGKVANDPSKRKAPAVAEVRHGPDGEAQAGLVRSALPKGTVIVVDKRKGATVDVALGAKFTGLAPAVTASGLPTCPAPTTS